MKKLNLRKVVKAVSTGFKKRSPEILMGVGIAGMLTTTVLAVKATPKALRLLDERKKEENTDKLTPVETVKTTWKCYIPAAITGTLSVACLIGSCSVSIRRSAALATAYQLAESTLKDYQDKVIETVGPKKEQAVRDAIAKDKIDKNPVTNTEVIVTGKGETLCYDVLSGRYFKSDIETLRKAANRLSRQLLDEMYVSLNDFYYEIGLKAVQLGDELGWNVDKGLIEVEFSSQLAEDGTPCLVLGYRIAPQYQYRCF